MREGFLIAFELKRGIGYDPWGDGKLYKEGKWELEPLSVVLGVKTL